VLYIKYRFFLFFFSIRALDLDNVSAP